MQICKNSPSKLRFDIHIFNRKSAFQTGGVGVEQRGNLGRLGGLMKDPVDLNCGKCRLEGFSIIQTVSISVSAAGILTTRSF